MNKKSFLLVVFMFFGVIISLSPTSVFAANISYPADSDLDLDVNYQNSVSATVTEVEISYEIDPNLAYQDVTFHIVDDKNQTKAISSGDILNLTTPAKNGSGTFKLKIKQLPANYALAVTIKVHVKDVPEGTQIPLNIYGNAILPQGSSQYKSLGNHILVITRPDPSSASTSPSTSAPAPASTPTSPSTSSPAPASTPTSSSTSAPAPSSSPTSSSTSSSAPTSTLASSSTPSSVSTSATPSSTPPSISSAELVNNRITESPRQLPKTGEKPNKGIALLGGVFLALVVAITLKKSRA